MRWPKLYRIQPPLDDVLLLAHFRLLGDKNITSYTMVDGKENRQTANPFARIDESFKRFKEVAIETTHRIKEWQSDLSGDS